VAPGRALDSVLPPVFIVISAFPYFFLGLLLSGSSG